MKDTWVNEISSRYIELFEKVTGRAFIKADYTHVLADVEKAILAELKNFYSSHSSFCENRKNNGVSLFSRCQTLTRPCASGHK